MKKILIFLVIVLLISLTSCLESKENILHSKVNKVTDYLYEITYYNYEEDIFDLTLEHYEKYKVTSGACSSVQNGMIRGRNSDWYYDEEAEFVIKVEASTNRHASIGIANAIAYTIHDVDGNDDLELYKILPYLTMDGINDAGIVVNLNVVPYGDMGTSVLKTADPTDDIFIGMINRVILDNASTLEEAINLIKDMDIFAEKDQNEAHLMISGPTSSTDPTYNTLVIEFIPDENNHYQLSIIDYNKGDFVDNKPIMTNFYLTGFDGSVESLTLHPMGYERYLILNEYYEEANTIKGMQDLLKKVYYSKMYDTYLDRYWYTENCIGPFTINNIGELCINGDPKKAGAYEEVVIYNNAIYENWTRTQEDKGWHTIHSSVYDCENKILYITPQEGEVTYTFKLIK